MKIFFKLVKLKFLTFLFKGFNKRMTIITKFIRKLSQKMDE